MKVWFTAGVTAQLPFVLMLEASRGQTSKVAARYGCSQWAREWGLHLTQQQNQPEPTVGPLSSPRNWLGLPSEISFSAPGCSRKAAVDDNDNKKSLAQQQAISIFAPPQKKQKVKITKTRD